MIIDPLKPIIKSISTKQAQNKEEQILTAISSYLIEGYSELLIEVARDSQKNKLIEKIVKEKLYKDYPNIDIHQSDIIQKIMNRFFGYHILQKYIENTSISDIRIKAWDTVYIKQKGKWIKTNDKFADENDFLNFVRYCVIKNNGKITQEVPMVVVSDKINKLRIEAGINPVNIKSPNLVIRIHRPELFTSLDELYIGESHMFNIEIYYFLLEAITAGCNIIISGTGGSGKTTILRALIDKIPEHLSITSNEESAELFSRHPNIIERQIVQNREKDKNITLQDLTKHCLVMSNDVIVVGEMKGAEAMAFFDAVSTGHRGYATVHSDSAIQTLDRLVMLMKRDPLAQQYSDLYLREVLSQSVDLIIYMKNFKVNEITQVIHDNTDGSIAYHPLFKFNIEKIVNGEVAGSFKRTGKPIQRVKEKIDIMKNEFDRLYGGVG